MPRYVLDTSLYIRATRTDVGNDELQAFSSSHAPFLYLHSVVAGELLAGAGRPSLEERTQARFIAPFEATGRVVVPTHEAWKRAGRAIAQLVRAGRLSPNGIVRSFMNDCLIAASAREHGFTLVTENARDYELIATVLPVSFTPPWPRDLH
ncbi:MAG: type II toxin-antitoxin system VapC family toxin [Longimicrobiaceae bacterium]